MSHGPPAELEKDNAAPEKARIGLILFFVYGLIYAGFVAVNTFSPKAMSLIVLSGLNLAVVYGFGLIVLAIVMGLIYNYWCGRLEARMNTDEEGNEA